MFNYFKSKRRRLNLIASGIHAIFMIALTLIYLSLPYTIDEENLLIKISSAVKRALIKDEVKPDKERFLFVCVSWDKELVDKVDTVSGFPVGQIDITDRTKLGKLVQRINSKPDNHKFIIVDVRFHIPSPNDSLLNAELPNLQNGLVSYHKGPDDKPDYPLFNPPLGLSDMQSQYDDEGDEMVLKYHLVQGDTLKTTPLLMYEYLYDTKLKRKLFYDELNGKRIFNSYILDYPIRSYDLFQAKTYNYTYLGELLNLPEPFFHEITKDKIIIVGDFENLDIHKTIYGSMPGPLILLNAFLSLENEQNVFSIKFVLFLFIFFTLISYKAINVRDPITVFVEKKFSKYAFISEFFVDVSFYLVYFTLVALASYYFFNIQITILILSFYLSFLEKVLVYLHQQRKAKIRTQNVDNSLSSKETI